MEDKFQTNEYIRNRIMQLVNSVDVNVIDIGPAIGKKKSYISDISYGRMLPAHDALKDLCDYFGITIAEFFDEQIDNPIAAKQIALECQRLCGNNTERFLRVLKLMEPSHMEAFLDFAKRIDRNGNI